MVRELTRILTKDFNAHQGFKKFLRRISWLYDCILQAAYFISVCELNFMSLQEETKIKQGRQEILITRY